MLIQKNYFWFLVCFIYIVIVTIINFNIFMTLIFARNIFISMFCIAVIRLVLLKKPFAINSHTFEHSKDFVFRYIWLLISVIWLIYWPINS